MGDQKVESFKKSISKSVDTWGKEVEKIAKQIDTFIAEFRTQRDTLFDAVKATQRGLNEQIKKVKIPAGADDKEVEAVVPWFHEVLAKKLKLLENSMKITPSASLHGDHLWIDVYGGGWKRISFHEV